MTLDKAIESYLVLKSKYPEIILGGSTALILRKAIIDRNIKDLDIISPSKYKFTGGQNDRGSDNDECLSCKEDNIKFDVYHNDNIVPIIMDYNGIQLLVQPIETILEAKFRYILKGATKHIPDIIQYLTTIK